MANCMYCGIEIPEGSAFCPKCGKKQAKVYSQTFQRGKMTEEEFFNQINQWFAMYPHVANVKGEFLIHDKTGLFVNKYVVDAFAIQYELLSGTNENQYGVVKLSTVGLAKTTTDALLHQWQQANPGAKILSRRGGVNQRGQAGRLALGGIGAVNNTQLYVFFKFNRATGTALLNP